MAKKFNYVKNGIQYYRKTKTIGHKPDGTPIKKEFYGDGEKDCDRQIEEFMKNFNLGLINNNQILTINILLPKWLFSVKKNELKPSSFETYESIYRNYIKDSFIANIPINTIKSLKIQEYYNKLIQNKVSTNNIKKIHKLLRQFFGYADLEGYILKNPCINVTLPKNKKENSLDIINKKKNKFNYFNETEINILKQALQNNKYEKIILFALGTGMRQGEILGLQWEDVNFENKEINVMHNLNTAADISEDGKRTYTTNLQIPKTENSIRIIPMSSNIYNLLKNLPHISNYVFCKEDGKYIDAKDLQKNWKKILLKTNIPYKKFHDLRHTFATMLLSHGANLITVKELLGHSSIKITEIYLDVLPKTKKDIIEKIDFILN